MIQQNSLEEKIVGIKQRILYLPGLLGIKRCEFVNKIGVSNSIFSGQNKNTWLSGRIFYEIIATYPQVSLDWILMGWGNPFRDTPPDTSVREVVINRPQPKKQDEEVQIPGFDKLLDKIEEQAKKIALLEYQLEHYKNKEEGGSTSGTRPGKKVHPATPGM